MSNSPFLSINPYTGENQGSFPCMPNEAINPVLEKMQAAQKNWKNKPVKERIAFLPVLSKLLKEHADDLAKTAAMEMGKVFVHAKAEVLKSASLCDYYYHESESLIKSKFQTAGNGFEVELKYEPMGIILGIFPWNFPYWQILRSAIPTLISGNAMLVKPAPNVPRSSLALQDLLNACGLPEFLYVSAFLSEEQISRTIEHTAVSAVTLTGSERAGKAVASQAALQIKPSVLELGGSDPLIILKDAPLDEIMDQILFSRFQNNGQSCVAAKRFIVDREIIEPFSKLMLQKMTAFQLGDPIKNGTDIGPMARKDLRDLLEQQVNDTLKAGAKLIYRHPRVPETGFFYPPTVLGNIPKGSRAYCEELFGPVLSLYSFESIEEAIALANDSPFGLGASIYTSDPIQAEPIAAQLECGMVYINQMVKSDVGIPFGGVKHSGYGRELGPDGLFAFCQKKAIWRKK